MIVGRNLAKVAVVAWIALVMSSANAQDFSLGVLSGQKGNGGDAVVCFGTPEIFVQVRDELLANRQSPNPTAPFSRPEVMADITSLQMLDVYEYLLPVGFPPKQRDMLTPSGDLAANVETVLTRASTKTGLGSVLRQELLSIPFGRWRASPGVIDIDDSDQTIVLPVQCLLVQIAARVEDSVYYDAQLFNRMDALNRLALVIHELIYKYAADNEQESSRSAREATGTVLSQSEFEVIPPLVLHKQLRPLGTFSFPYNVEGNQIWIESIEKESAAGLPLEVIVPAGGKLIWRAKTITIGNYGAWAEVNLVLNDDGDLVSVWGNFGFEQFQLIGNGMIELGADDSISVTAGPRFFGAKWLDLTFNLVSSLFIKDGYLDSVCVSQTIESNISIPQGLLYPGCVQFYPRTGIPQAATGSVVFRSSEFYGNLRLVGPISFYPDGTVAEAGLDSFAARPQLTIRTSDLELFVSALSTYVSPRLSFSTDGIITSISQDFGLRWRWTVGSTDQIVTAFKLREVEFYPGSLNQIRKLQFSDADDSVMDISGHTYPSETVRYPVKNREIELDETGHPLNFP